MSSSVERRLEVQIIDKIEQQVQHCLRSYENEPLEDKLIDLVKEWFFRGFFGGRDYQIKQDDINHKDNKMQYISLDEEDFSCLVRGGVLTVGGTQICLKDIGFAQMESSLESAQSGKDIRKDHVKRSLADLHQSE